MKRRESSTSLSSAAAAAALRALPASPTRVADVQTKRSVRRSASLSSRAGSDARRPTTLRRQPSSGSMTERTFRSRSTSPNRPDTVPLYADAPPVPSLPSSASGRASPTHRKHLSLDLTGFRAASEKVGRDGEPSWFGSPKGKFSNVRTSDQPMLQTYLAASPDDLPGSRGSSVNFSYPARTRPMSPSPPVSPTIQKHPAKPQPQALKRRPISEPYLEGSLIYDPNTRRMVPRVELQPLDTRKEAPDKFVRRKKSVQSRPDSHVSRPTASRCSSLSDAGPALHPDIDTQRRKSPSPERKKPMSPLQSPSQAQAAQLSSVDRRLGKKPSVVKEEPELEEEAEKTDEKSLKSHTKSDPNQPTSSLGRGLEPSLDVDIVWVESSGSPLTHRQQSLRNDGLQPGSPIRAPRFSLTPENLTIKHSPPPRSVSPRKSAMKHPRDNSPSENSESSLAAWLILDSQPQDKAALTRKKSVRVSFDDEKTKILEKIAPSGSEQQEQEQEPNTRTNRPWYSPLTKNKTKDFLSLDDDEMTMKPRPALPSFGSVRDRKPRDEDQLAQERPLVRPHDSDYSPAYSGTPPLQSNLIGNGDADVKSLATSNYHASSSLLYREKSSTNSDLDTPRGQEPLPPVVTSIEEYMSETDSNSSSESDGSNTLTGSQHQSETSPVATKAPLEPSLPFQAVIAQKDPLESTATTQTQNEIPAISVTHPSPRPAQPSLKGTYSNSSQSSHGNFPVDDSESSGNECAPPGRDTLSRASVDQNPPMVLTPSPNQDGSESDSSASVYTDAYEDLPTIPEDDGFMSIDAIVECPQETSILTSSTAPTKMMSPLSNMSTPNKNPPPSISTETTVQASPSEMVTQLSTSAIAVRSLGPQDEWEHAKVYWRSLSMTKRCQLEREATDEAGIEGDAEVEGPIHQMPKKKKSTDRRKKRSALRSDTARNPKDRSPDRVYQIQPGSKANHQPFSSPTMRTSLRDQNPARPVSREPKLKKSLRSSGSTATASKGSLHSQLSTDQGLLKPPVEKASASTRKSYTGDDSLALVTSPVGVKKRTAALARRGSGDSVSSFKRSHQHTTKTGPFRKSMRNPSPQITSQRSQRFSLRSLSPTESQIPGGSINSSPTMNGSVPGSSNFRHSLRFNPGMGSVGISKKGSGLHMPSFGRRGSETPKSRKQGFLGLSKVGSTTRFDDSSDEDSPVRVPGHLSSFRSRFVDSSDEDDPIHAKNSPKKGFGLMAKTMRGNVSKPSRNSSFVEAQPWTSSPGSPPRHAQHRSLLLMQASSTSLPDSSDDNIRNSPVLVEAPIVSAEPTPVRRTLSKGKQLRRSGSGRDSLGPTRGVSPTSGSLQQGGSGSSKRRSSLMSVLRRKKAGPVPGSIRRANTEESWARRDTNLERSESQLKVLRRVGGDEQVPHPVVKHAAGHAIGSAISRGQVVAEDSLISADFVSTSFRHDDGSISAVGGKKKKKFGTLRKILRLDD